MGISPLIYLALLYVSLRYRVRVLLSSRVGMDTEKGQTMILLQKKAPADEWGDLLLGGPFRVVPN